MLRLYGDSVFDLCLRIGAPRRAFRALRPRVRDLRVSQRPVGEPGLAPGRREIIREGTVLTRTGIRGNRGWVSSSPLLGPCPQNRVSIYWFSVGGTNS